MVRRWMGSTLVVLAFALLGGASTAAPGVSAPRASVTEFPLPHPESRPYSIVTGPDGNLWFTESDRSAIGRITPTGEITEFDTPDPGQPPLRDHGRYRRQPLVTEEIGNNIVRLQP